MVETIAVKLGVASRWLRDGTGPMDAGQAAAGRRKLESLGSKPDLPAEGWENEATGEAPPPGPDAGQLASAERALARRAAVLAGGLEEKLERTVAHIGAALRSWPTVPAAMHVLIRAEIDRQIEDYAAWCEATGKPTQPNENKETEE